MIQKIIEGEDYYRTPDLALATSISLFYPLEAIDKPPSSNRGFFLFKRSEQLDVLIESYHKREMRVEPATYFHQLRQIKSRLYGED